MCGILGIYRIDQGIAFDTDRFRSALLTMIHRGPDSSRIQGFEDRAIFGHVRLSIIDLSDENAQPMEVDDRYCIVYNGEIYNYLEIREELTKAGYTFTTKGDTEVILRAYQQWGRDCVSRFNGMWAFAIYDRQNSDLFCSRDRFGIKPFYYAVVNGNFIFSSEIKGIIACYSHLKEPDYSLISNYCRKGIGAQTRSTWFKNIYRLEPAHNISVSSTGMNYSRYWDYPKKIKHEITFDEAKTTYRELLTDSIRIRMRSDVPVGFTLSSGIDSSSIVCLLRNQYSGNKNTYTAAFSGTPFTRSEKQNFKKDITIDEPGLVRKLTRDLDLTSHIIEIDYENYLSDLKLIIRYLESGHASPAIFPLYHILDRARKDVTVVLEGQGADELLGGYIIDVFPVYILALIKRFRLRKAVNELAAYRKIYSLKMAFMIYVRLSSLKLLKRLYYRFSGMESFFRGRLEDFNEINDFPVMPSGFDDPMNEHLYKAHTGCLVDLLHYGDAISMAHSLESRQPFMDYRLVEYVFTLPYSYKIRDGKGKFLHREALRGIVPDDIIDNPVKFGFDSPLSQIFKDEGEGSAMSILLSDRCISRGLFSKKALIRAFREQKQNRKDHSRLLFRLLSVELWFREFIDQQKQNREP
ncbi:MAG TPA: asparagine synthase (glutamine-hydrolyzing) [Bacteroidales bacterium]|nr:asparagine synthase (glutamine-hydrolyzing) [Bacteroidales bacterium]